MTTNPPRYRELQHHAATARRHLVSGPASSWSESAAEWVDYATDLARQRVDYAADLARQGATAVQQTAASGRAFAWQAANAPGDFVRHNVDATARTLGQLAQDAQRQFRQGLSDTLKLMADTFRSMFEAVWGLPPLVMLLGGLAVAGGLGWVLLGTAGGQAALGSVFGFAGGAAGTGARWALRGGAAYATGGATEIARAAL